MENGPIEGLRDDEPTKEAKDVSPFISFLSFIPLVSKYLLGTYHGQVLGRKSCLPELMVREVLRKAQHSVEAQRVEK